MSFDVAKKHAQEGPSAPAKKRALPPPDKLLIQRAMADPARLDTPAVRRLQRIVGNRTLQRILARGKYGAAVQRRTSGGGASPVVQREDGDDESWDLGELFKSDEDKEADRAVSTYETVGPGMDTYAKRTALGSMRGKSKEGTLLPYSKALSLPRLPDGTLSPEAIAIMDEEQGKEAQGYVDASRQSGFRNAPVDKAGMRALKKTIKKATVGIADAQLNELTRKPRMPELMNLLKPLSGKALGAYQGATGKADESVVSSIEVAGVTMHVYHGVSDVNFRPRLKLFEGAIEKVQSAGFKLPGTLLVHLPKFGRPIDIKTMCEVAGGTPRAVFAAPNFIHLSSAVVGNPIDEKKGGDSYYTLSSNLDPEGPGTVVHEMGHLMHYQRDANSFYSLQSASLRQPMVARKVSTYATNNPREFVAEVFLGLVYGKSFDDDVIQMYNAFGGPMSDHIAAQIAGGRAGAGGGGGAV